MVCASHAYETVAHLVELLHKLSHHFVRHVDTWKDSVTDVEKRHAVRVVRESHSRPRHVGRDDLWSLDRDAIPRISMRRNPSLAYGRLISIACFTLAKIGVKTRIRPSIDVLRYSQDDKTTLIIPDHAIGFLNFTRSTYDGCAKLKYSEFASTLLRHYKKIVATRCDASVHSCDCAKGIMLRPP